MPAFAPSIGIALTVGRVQKIAGATCCDSRFRRHCLFAFHRLPHHEYVMHISKILYAYHHDFSVGDMVFENQWQRSLKRTTDDVYFAFGFYFMQNTTMN
jgi:hypothetical protein